MAEPAIAHADEACAVGTIGNVCAAVWVGECTPARNEAWVRATHDLARRLKSPIGVVSIVTEGAPSPSSPIRTAQGGSLEELSRTAFAAGAIVDGAGFRAGMVRAVIASVSALARYKCPFRVVATDAEMARWLQERSVVLKPEAASASEHELRALFAAIRGRVQK